ncbi:N-carbamoylputrescine amidase [Tistlia consotensis]|uniref:N-carbamoylputrescine amidase n=1 Tax=Tistlia consotensis USBA 355 TaxID=560819 RepID=A0A1Y6BSQ1_9PROT|nr:N-carbamoylputrescine amidase [Tistlia consotensis]SMF16201.1 N-carbamoylputrescine amidase [Tistlia consotensis USBA 355]SNR41345.1 N-carbamoylputrescine amidase [Tistlia consotensis]
MTTITLAATQMACDWDSEANLKRAEGLVREAAAKGADVVLLQELFETPYFCPDQKEALFALARPFKDNPVVARFADLAKELGVVLPVSFFERANNAHYNSIAIADADGAVLGLYRKSHIPDGPGYQEKYYFNPGDTGFRVWDTRFGRLGVGICWDQWFPECARAMALKGAEVLLYPTAIGIEPQDPTIDSLGHWQRAMQGHAAANMVPLVASNRIGSEPSEAATMTFYGSSFIADELGAKLAEASQDRQEVVTATVDLDRIRARRASWGFYRDRRPDLYRPLLTLDGETEASGAR